MLDARYEKVRVDGKVVGQAVLVVVGFDAGGRREVLDWRVCDSESEQAWGEGIRSAVSRHFQGACWQRCRVHLKRELGNRVPWRLRKELMKDLAAVFAPWE